MMDHKSFGIESSDLVKAENTERTVVASVAESDGFAK
jgi:hypothetical protein